MVEASIKESKISGSDRAVAWDGATTGGQELQNQVRCFPAHSCNASPVPLSTCQGSLPCRPAH